MKQKAKDAGFQAFDRPTHTLVIHRCDASVLPRANVTLIDQETTRYECPRCGAEVTTRYEDR